MNAGQVPSPGHCPALSDTLPRKLRSRTFAPPPDLELTRRHGNQAQK